MERNEVVKEATHTDSRLVEMVIDLYLNRRPLVLASSGSKCHQNDTQVELHNLVKIWVQKKQKQNESFYPNRVSKPLIMELMNLVAFLN